MLETPEITRTTARPSAAIHLVIPHAEIQSVMGPGLTELMATIAAQGIKPTGPWFTHHFRMIPDSWDFEICVPVSAPVAAAGRVRPSEWPAMNAARAVYVGPYQGLGEAWGELHRWIAAKGHATAPDIYECYLAGPESSPDPARWRTELTKPLAS